MKNKSGKIISIPLVNCQLKDRFGKEYLLHLNGLKKLEELGRGDYNSQRDIFVSLLSFFTEYVKSCKNESTVILKDNFSESRKRRFRVKLKFPILMSSAFFPNFKCTFNLNSLS